MSDSEVINIDPEGDVVLVFGSDDNIKKIRVRSVILSMSSKVFKKLHSPQFKEGSQLAATSSLEIPLPDDDPAAMEIICNVTHFHNRSIPESLEPEELLAVAQLVDKYACMEAMKHVAESWLHKYADENDQETLSRLYAAAFYFGDKGSCDSFGEKLLMCSLDTVTDISSCDRKALKDMFETLEELRQQIHRDIAEVVQSELECIVDIQLCRTCGNGAVQNAFQLLATLGAASVLESRPTSRNRLSLGKMLDMLDSFVVDGILSLVGFNFCASCRDIYMQPWELRDRYGKKARKIRKSIIIPCLTCVQEGKPTSDASCSHSESNKDKKDDNDSNEDSEDSSDSDEDPDENDEQHGE